MSVRFRNSAYAWVSLLPPTGDINSLPVSSTYHESQGDLNMFIKKAFGARLWSNIETSMAKYQEIDLDENNADLLGCSPK